MSVLLHIIFNTISNNPIITFCQHVWLGVFICLINQHYVFNRIKDELIQLLQVSSGLGFLIYTLS